MIICTGPCAKEKDESEFYGRMKTCKECHKKTAHANHVRDMERKLRRELELKSYRHPVRLGDTFFAKIKKHYHSKNMLGEGEFAGQIIGEFVCTDAAKSRVNAGGRQFAVEMFEFEVITE